MQSDTRIFIFRLRQLLTILFIIGMLLAVAIFVMTRLHMNKKDVQTTPASASAYTAGVYTSSIQLDNQTVDIQVIVDQDRIKSASIVHLDESVAAMYPLLTTSMDAISSQLSAGISVDDITYSASSRYTSQVLLGAISRALEKAH